MLRRLVWGVSWVCLLLAGCTGYRDLYQAELVRTQELEASGGDLSARLSSERARREELEGILAERDGEVRSLRENLAREQARASDRSARLEECSVREGALGAQLDLCRKENASVKTEREALREELGVERAARSQERAAILAELESCRGEVVDLAARGAVLEEQQRLVQREKREKLDEISRTYEGLLTGLKEEVEKGRVTISQLRGKLTVNLLDEILFDSGSAAVKPEGRAVLQRLGEVLRAVSDKAIVIEGHTDNVPISGDLAKRYPSNWELATSRATSVVRYLEEQAGLDPQRLSVVGFGPHRPVASNETREGRARNRRIEVKLLPLEAPLLAPAAEEAPEGVPEGQVPAPLEER